jgi:hypothetical protein
MKRTDASERDPDFDALANATEEIVRHAQPEGENLASLQGRFAAFQRWCDEHSLSALPATEQTLLRFLHAHHPDWSFGNARAYVHAIVWKHRSMDLSSPRDGRVADYLQHLREETGTRVEPLVDALRTSDAARIAEWCLSKTFDFRDAGGEQLLVRAVLVVARFTGLPVGDSRRNALRVLDLPASAFTCTSTEVRIRIPKDCGGDHTKLVRVDTSPVEYWILRDWLTAADGANFPFLANGSQRERTRVLDAIRCTRRRAGVEISAGLKEDLLDETRWRWLLACANRPTRQHLRNLAYVLVGTFTARRHAELQRANIEHVSRTDTGFVLLVPKSKGKRDARVYQVDHTHPGKTCLPVCPACALERWLEFEAVCGKRTTGILFPTTYGGLRRMTRQNGRRLIRQVWCPSGGDPDAKIGTRSLRVGGATSADEKKMSLEDIARDVTDHEDLNTCDLYIRRPAGEEYQLIL